MIYIRDPQTSHVYLVESAIFLREEPRGHFYIFRGRAHKVPGVRRGREIYGDALIPPGTEVDDLMSEIAGDQEPLLKC